MSKKKTVALAEATFEQMRQFAQNHLGIVFDADMDEAKMRSVIKAAHDKPTISVEEEVTPPAMSSAASDDGDPKPMKVRLPKNEPKVTVRIASSPEPGGKDPVFVSVGGVAMFIPRDKPSTIRRRYYWALMLAEHKLYDYDPETSVTTERVVTRHPVSVLSDPAGVAAEFERERARVMKTAA
jgi:hypothetical protein